MNILGKGAIGVINLFIYFNLKWLKDNLLIFASINNNTLCICLARYYCKKIDYYVAHLNQKIFEKIT